MNVTANIIVGVVIAIGLIGIVVPLLPGGILILGAIIVWAAITGGTTAWIVAAIAAVVIVSSWVVKYIVAGRSAKVGGVPTRSIIVGGLVGIVGFFVVPVIGLLLGFVAGVLVAELIRTQELPVAWRGALVATKAALLTIVIELLGGLVATTGWIAGLIAV